SVKRPAAAGEPPFVGDARGQSGETDVDGLDLQDSGHGVRCTKVLGQSSMRKDRGHDRKSLRCQMRLYHVDPPLEVHAHMIDVLRIPAGSSISAVRSVTARLPAPTPRDQDTQGKAAASGPRTRAAAVCATVSSLR